MVQKVWLLWIVKREYVMVETFDAGREGAWFVVGAQQYYCLVLNRIGFRRFLWNNLPFAQAAKKMEKELRLQIERLQEDKNYNDQMYREVSTRGYLYKRSTNHG